jgi:tRNA A58 N-methylase Trm61
MSDCYDRFAKLKKFTDSVGGIYGTEDLAVYLYSIVKMLRPNNVLELGTGFGSTSLWMALALQENGKGILHTVDDGSEWESLKGARDSFGEYYNDIYYNYVVNLIDRFDLKKEMRFHHSKVETLNYCDEYDVLFSDFSHGPFFITKLIADCLPRMSENSYIFIDSASTYHPSFLTLNAIVDSLNRGKIPRTLLELIDPNMIESFKDKVLSSHFELTHVIENKDRNQNSTAQIRILPYDNMMPQPRVNIRF